MAKSKWENTYHYQRLMQILEDYWLSEPDEAYVLVEMEFLKSDGQYQKKYIEWWNPKVDGKKTKAMLEEEHRQQQEALEEAKRCGVFITYEDLKGEDNA